MNPKSRADDYERPDITLAIATTATAEAVAAVAAVQAAVEAIRLSSPSTTTSKYFRAAIMIQSAFRAYLVIMYPFMHLCLHNSVISKMKMQ